MEVSLAVSIGVLYATGLYMMLRRSLTKLLIGLALLSHGTNLLIFTAGGLTRAAPPLVAEGRSEPSPPFADPLTQALILTAIVISFGVLAFTVALLLRTSQALGTDDMDTMTSTDR